MPTITESVTIPRTPQEVYDFISVADNLPVWDVSVVRAEQVGNDPIAIGTRSRGTSKIMGKNFDWTTEVTQLDAPSHLVFSSVEGRLTFTVTNTLEAVEGGTRLTYVIDAESGLGGVFGRLADPLVERVQDRTVRSNLETLVDLLSNHPDPTALHVDEV